MARSGPYVPVLKPRLDHTRFLLIANLQSLVDHHTHFSMNALSSHRLDLQKCRSAAEVVKAVTEALSDPRFDEKIELNFVGVNMRTADWPDLGDMNRSTLDAITSRPVFLIFNGYHSMCLNSPALRIGGYDPQGHNGLLLEQEAFDITKKLSNVAVPVLDNWVAQEAKAAA